jgi:hypothetical protein
MRALIRLAGIGVVGTALFYIASIHGQMLSRPQAVGVVLVVAALAMSLALLAWLASGTGRADGRDAGSPRARPLVRAMWVGVTAYAFVGVVTFFTMLSTSEPDGTPYHNDAIALNQCAVELLLEGKNPYSQLDIFACYDELGIGPDRTTPLQRGLFSGIESYPTDQQLWNAWQLRRMAPETSLEFEWRPSYPALAFLLLVPPVVLGIDPNHLSAALLLLGMALVLVRTERTARGLMLTALLGSIVVIAWTIGGSSDLLYAIPLLAAWMWRERRWSALLLAIACATKQLAWFVAPFYLMQVAATRGWGEAARRLGMVALVFAVTNAPFALADPSAWIAGVTTPIREPMFPRGSGLVFLSTGGVLPLAPAALYAALEAASALVMLVVAWRARRSSPEVGLVLAFIPLFFAWRSLFSYFFLLPLFAAAAVARMPLGLPEPERIEAAGGVALVDGPRRPADARAA